MDEDRSGMSMVALALVGAVAGVALVLWSRRGKAVAQESTEEEVEAHPS